MSDPRAIVAAEHGLDERAAHFLTGDTIEQLEASAGALAKLLGDARGEGQDPAPARDPINAALAAKAQRKRALAALFTGRAPRQRDERGRFASTGFDGGARRPSPLPRDPEREHGQLIGHMAAISRTFGATLSTD